MLSTHAVSQDSLFVYPIMDQDDLDAVYRLTHDTFVRRGICQPQANGMLVHNPQLDQSADTIILVAKQRGEVLATLSLTLGQKHEDIYNHEIFKEDLTQEPMESGTFFSAWRLAVKTEGPYSRFLVLQLILKGMQHLLQHNARVGYMCFRSEHLQFYRRVLPEGMLIGTREKKTELIHTELCMWKCYLSEERYTFLHQMVLKLCER